MQTQTHTWLRHLRSLAGVALLFSVNLVARRQECKPHVLEGEVQQGEAWQAAISPALDLKLEAVPAGWIVRVLPHGGKRPPHDAAELANPPYRSPTPILISTDFAFRAQDAIAWNPRRFRFFTTPAQTAQAEAIYQATLRNPDDRSAAAALSRLLAAAPEATLQIVDAEIAGGTADQTAAAATVASHFEQTAHTLRTNGSPSPLGALLRLRFRVTVPAFGGNCRR
ncbi:hypothetical protein [Terriglobus sp.]|uniref:hypothetical protein n=1 Tax=Terriglobus sp. TaxID=1889013 RepID=UPI003AFF8896